MTLSPSDLRKIPLFQNITDNHLAELMSAFERAHLRTGEVLFESGSKPEHLLLLVSGEVVLKEGNTARFVLAPVAPIGELGAVTGTKRNTTAVTTKPSEVWRIGTGALMDFFEKHGDVAFPFHNNLLRIVADKVRRDTRLLDEIRGNIIRTQKTMKRLRDVVLEAEETPISKTLLETLEDTIEQNRRSHYLVEPMYGLATRARLDSGETVDVLEMSDSVVRLDRAPAESGKHVSFVLVLPDAEFPVSGKITTGQGKGAIVELDLLIDEYASKLQQHLTRIQMLDFVV